jgi:lambda family phage portal protein
MNFIDNIVGFFAPKAGVRRMQARVALAVLDEQRRKYEAAGRGRRTNGLPRYDGSANTEIALDLKVLRAGSRHMIRNNGYARKAVRGIVNNVVGTGIQPSPKSQSKGKVKLVKKLWKDWGESKECDFDGKKNFYGLTSLIMRAVVESGEVIVLKRRVSNKGKNPIKLQVLEADFLDSSKDIKNLSNGGYITQGVEFNKDGVIRGYWIFQSHPGEYGYRESKLRPAKDVLHIYDMERPGQVRGVPFIAASMLRLKDFDDYEDAEVVRQKIAACFAAFIQDADPESSVSTNEADLLERLEPGVIEHLPPGKTISFASPPTTQNYDGFSRKVLQGVAAGFGITYEVLTGDLSNVNFTSYRVGFNEMTRQVEEWQYNMLIPMLCEEVFKWFLLGETLSNGLKTDDIYCDWTPPRRQMIDPKKETDAMIAQIRSGLTSWQQVVRENGFEPDQILEELKEDMDKFKLNGLILDVDGSQVGANKAPIINGTLTTE